MNQIIRKADFAREIGVTRARVTQMCARGLPVREDGRLNRVEALRWVRDNVISERGGWESTKQTVTTPDASDATRLYDYEVLSRCIEIAREEGIISAINQLREPKNRLKAARMALRVGCTMQQAWAVAEWLELFLAFCYKPEDPEREFLESYEEPDWNRFAQDEANTTADVESWRGWMNRCFDVEPEKVEA